MDRLDLLPGGGTAPRQIAAGPVLGHHAFLAPPHRFLEKDSTSSFHARGKHNAAFTQFPHKLLLLDSMSDGLSVPARMT